MNTFLKSVRSASGRRNALVKDSLRKRLNQSVMEIEGAASGSSVGNCDEAATLCSILEATFLHGLKDSLLNRVTEVLSGPDFDATPQPSFWGPLLVFSHREIIDRIQSMKQITTEVGYCRAWIRLALNEGLLSSYLASMRRDDSALKPYYERAAFMRDSDLIDVAQRLVESLDHVNFELACNSGLLNFWSSTPLLMAAIWSPPMKSCPVFSAVDIAKTINSDETCSSYDNYDDVEIASSIGSLASFNSSQSMLNKVASVTEDEALKIIPKENEEIGNSRQQRRSSDSGTNSPTKRVWKEKKRTDVEKQGVDESPAGYENADREKKEQADRVTGDNAADGQIDGSNDDTNDDEMTNSGEKVDVIAEIEEDDENTEQATGNIGNSLIGRPGWSTSFDDPESSMTTSIVSARGSENDSSKTPNEITTYDALIKSYHTAGFSASPDLGEFLEKYDKDESIKSKPKPQREVKVLDNLEEQIGRLPRERGLDVQNYSCLDCGHPIGMTFAKAHVCSFSGYYFCENCMANEEFLIPSRIIHNWDLKHYPVCRRVGNYLTDCPTLLNLKILNPRIYMAVDSMAQLQSLRIRLNLLRAYLFSCREPIIESLRNKVQPREYLYKHVHQYSVTDLLDVPSGAMAQQLQKIVEFARRHVIDCWLCSQKGFICEVCNNPKVIYPFDMESTYRCSVCNAVFHGDCLSSNEPCPKCERRRKRVDRPLPEGIEIFNAETIGATSASAI